MSYNYAAHHRTQPPPDAKFPYWPAQPHSFHSAVQPWHQTYQFGVPLWEEPTRHILPPRPNTQPWQQPPDPPDWQHNPQPQQSASQAGGCTKPTCSLPTISDPVLSPVADSPPLDPIRTMFEHLVASMARLESRMDDFLGLHEGFRQNPNGQSSSLRQPAILPIADKPPGLTMKPPHFDGPLQQHTSWEQHQEPVLDPPPPQTLLSRGERKVANNRESVNPVEESESDSSEEGSSSEEESDADLDPTPPQNRPQPQIPAAKPSQPLPHPSSDDEDDFGSETESESDALEVRPLAAKLVEGTPKSNRKAKSKPAADPITLGKSAATSKRPTEDMASKDAKKPIRRAFDPGGDISHLAYVISDFLHCFVVSTLRTRWILTEGELIREYLQQYPQISLI